MQKLVTFNGHAISIETPLVALWQPRASFKRGIDPIPALERCRQSSRNPFRLSIEGRFNRYDPPKLVANCRDPKNASPQQNEFICAADRAKVFGRQSDLSADSGLLP